MSDDLAATLERARQAKAAYRDDPSDTNRAGHRTASEQLRYVRWLARGGPAAFQRLADERNRQNEALEAASLPPIMVPLRDEDLYVRWAAENEES